MVDSLEPLDPLLLVFLLHLFPPDVGIDLHNPLVLTSLGNFFDPIDPLDPVVIIYQVPRFPPDIDFDPLLQIAQINFES